MNVNLERRCYMKQVINIIKDFLLGVWVIFAIATTVCLLSYNEFNVPSFGSTTVLAIDSDEMEPDFLEGDLLLIKRESDKKIDNGDKVFFYNGNKVNEYLINIGTVEDKTLVTSKESTYTINNNKVSGSYVIGRVNATKIIHNIGYVYNVLTSKWGFMFLIIFPTIFLIMYEILMIIDATKALKDETDLPNEKATVTD